LPHSKIKIDKSDPERLVVSLTSSHYSPGVGERQASGERRQVSVPLPFCVSSSQQAEMVDIP
jgi:hypothetical protein